jgi:hypothetical protein
LELLERIRVLVARKRGPKKHLPISNPPAQPMLVQSSANAQSSQDEQVTIKHAIAS